LTAGEEEHRYDSWSTLTESTRSRPARAKDVNNTQLAASNYLAVFAVI